ncbi:MAG: hypothetical protein P9L92_08900 [Candidatus Electryonea clarkiae]|nr:hypothetical protein [Candidatus Electryonea clarkiae]MDP8285900.1 hypothetical protein [Candidatus Electryonea clarkiae]
MKHPDDDTILKLSLDLLDDDDTKNIKSHISRCDECGKKHQKATDDIELIGSFELPVKSKIIPLPRSRHHLLRTVLKAVAILVFGFITGYSVSELTHESYINVVPHHPEVEATRGSVNDLVVCESIDLVINLDFP